GRADATQQKDGGGAARSRASAAAPVWRRVSGSGASAIGARRRQRGARRRGRCLCPRLGRGQHPARLCNAPSSRETIARPPRTAHGDLVLTDYLNWTPCLRAMSFSCSGVSCLGGAPGVLDTSRKKASSPGGATTHSNSSSLSGFSTPCHAPLGM